MSNVDTLYLIHHSHTDIGYTHDQPILWDLQTRFIDEVIDLAERFADHDDDSAFRWTVETTGVLMHWLHYASDAQIDRFLALERAGRIEVTGMLANITPLYDTDQLIESVQPLRALRQVYGCTIRHAMNCDVNGQNWPLVDVLLDAGISSLSMAINKHSGGIPFHRPYPFWWQGPSGRRLLTFNGFHYGEGWRLGIGRDEADFETNWWPRLDQWLGDHAYPLSSLMVQSIHPFGDNGTGYASYSACVAAWNARGKRPRLRLATPSMWIDALRAETDRLPSHAGDWTDYWNFGCGSSAREQRINRESRVRLRTADALAVAASADAESHATLHRCFDRHRDDAWHNLLFWDEHTWGADMSVRNPESDDTLSQWYHKARYAYRARSLSLMLQRDGLATLARLVHADAPDDLLVFNPLPWPRQLSGLVSPFVVTPRGSHDDATASRHFQDHSVEREPLSDVTDPKERSHLHALPPTDVPGFGFAVVARDRLINLHETTVLSDTTIVENHRHRLTFDPEKGGILSWHDKLLDHEWVDGSDDYRFNGYVHEQVADTAHEWPRSLQFSMDWGSQEIEVPSGWQTGWDALRRQPERVVLHQVLETPLGWYVEHHLQAPGCVGPLRQRVFLPHDADYVECEASWEMGLTTHPEATYLVYPFNLPEATARFDLGGQAVEAGRDQLAGVCRDYFTVQNWVDVAGRDRGMLIATPENPLIQLGGFHFGQHQQDFTLERPRFLGWVTNNYWETNFRAHQPGRVRARYRLLPYRGGFDETRAHRFGLEAAQAQPLVQHCGEPSAGQPLAAATGNLLDLPGANTPVHVLHIKPADRWDQVVVRLLNASDEAQTARIGSALLCIQGAHTGDLFENPVEPLDVQQGVVTVTLPPRRLGVVLLDLASP